ncbi:DUF424 family protein [Candidatus Woesearchaeota archaeon]|nr:DUF424 family protein [Candidatus Woesearchaeota archaeon]
MIVKAHYKDNKTIITSVDKEIIGKKLEENNKILDLTNEYYQGKEMTEEETTDLLRNADIIQVVGKKSIMLAKKEGLIEEKNIIHVQDTPFAQAVIIRE